MVCTLHDDDVVSLGISPRNFDGGFDSLRPRVPEEERLERRVRHHRQQLLHKLDVWLRQGDCALDVNNRLSLRDDRLGNGGMSVSQRRDSDSRGEVEQSFVLLQVSDTREIFGQPTLTVVKTRKPLPSLNTCSFIRPRPFVMCLSAIARIPAVSDVLSTLGGDSSRRMCGAYNSAVVEGIVSLI